MLWFEGGIPAAIASAKENKSVFIVFISDDQEASKEMETMLHNDSVTKACEDAKCVSLRLEAGSNDCKFFSQLYPVVVVPCTFLMSPAGVPLEVVGSQESQDEFTSKVKAAIDMQEKMQKELTDTSETNSDAKGDENTQGTDETPPAEGETNKEDKSEQDEPEEKKQKTIEDKVERAKELVEQKRQDKLRKEAEDLRRKEIERRQLGQGVQKLKEKQKEMEVLEARREFKKSKEDDKLARQRVKEEIARDRAERAARSAKEKEERQKAAEEDRKRKLEEQASQQAENARRSDFARLQFRLPDGSSLTQQFSATDNFSSVVNYVSDNVGSGVRLSTTFPRRTFTASDNDTSLRDLQLAPSAVILVLPGSSSGVRSSKNGGGLAGLLSVLFAPLWALWGALAALLGVGSASNNSSPSTSAATAVTARGGDHTGARGAASRQDGAVHRFRNADDDRKDDENNTWNGNSTQQL